MSGGASDNRAVVPDLPTAQALVRLRLLSDEAARRCDDNSPAGQHQALIALDGACEFALWLAAHRRDIEVKHGTGFAVLYSKIVEATGWRFPGWVTVKQMHEARNSAQHAAVISDSSQMPGWRDVSLAFIDAICVEVFDTRLTDILLSDAVRDLSLREMLRAGEEKLSVSTVESVSFAFRALDLALYGWRKQLGHAVVPLFPQGQQIPEPTSTLMVGFDEVQPFATNPGEYVWLRRAWQEVEMASWVPTVEDARRALAFVTTWVVRWELFTLGYPDAEWAAHRDAIEPPSYAQRPGLHIYWAHPVMRPEAPHQPPENVIHFQLVNVPGRGRAPWDVILRDALTEVARELGATPFRNLSWSTYGLLTVNAELDADPSVVADVVESALERAAERFAAASIESEERERARKKLESELVALVRENADAAIGLITEVRVVKDEWLGTSDWMALFAVPSSSPELLELNSLLNAFRNQRLSGQGGTLLEVHVRTPDEMRLIIGELTDEMKVAAVAAIKSAEEQVAHVRNVRANQAETSSAFAAEIRKRFPYGPKPGPEEDHTVPD